MAVLVFFSLDGKEVLSHSGGRKQDKQSKRRKTKRMEASGTRIIEDRNLKMMKFYRSSII